jgi:hypothetical protein
LAASGFSPAPPASISARRVATRSTSRAAMAMALSPFACRLSPAKACYRAVTGKHRIDAMILIISVGLAVMIACLAVQIVSVVGVVRYYAEVSRQPIRARAFMSVFRQLAAIMTMLLVSSLLQMASWAALYLWLDQFDDFQTAIYFSGVTFTSLGYGDLTLEGRARILSAMEAADGLMMFGVTSAVFMIVLQHSITRWHGIKVDSGKR